MNDVESVKVKTLQQVVREFFADNTKVKCGGYRSYGGLDGVEFNCKRYKAVTA